MFSLVCSAYRSTSKPVPCPAVPATHGDGGKTTDGRLVSRYSRGRVLTDRRAGPAGTKPSYRPLASGSCGLVRRRSAGFEFRRRSVGRSVGTTVLSVYFLPDNHPRRALAAPVGVFGAGSTRPPDRPMARSNITLSVEAAGWRASAVSYTHLTLPTIYSV